MSDRRFFKVIVMGGVALVAPACSGTTTATEVDAAVDVGASADLGSDTGAASDVRDVVLAEFPREGPAMIDAGADAPADVAVDDVAKDAPVDGCICEFPRETAIDWCHVDWCHDVPSADAGDVTDVEFPREGPAMIDGGG